MDLFPPVDREAWETWILDLCWHQHGGSGLTWTRSEVLDLTLGERDRAREWVKSRRAAEAKELKKGGRGR